MLLRQDNATCDEILDVRNLLAAALRIGVDTKLVAGEGPDFDEESYMLDMSNKRDRREIED
jgi:hypothetical protein